LNEAQVATSAGIADVFLHRKRSGRCMSWRPRRNAVTRRLKPCPRKASTLAEINKLLWLLFLKEPGALCQVFLIIMY